MLSNMLKHIETSTRSISGRGGETPFQVSGGAVKGGNQNQTQLHNMQTDIHKLIDKHIADIKKYITENNYLSHTQANQLLEQTKKDYIQKIQKIINSQTNRHDTIHSQNTHNYNIQDKIRQLEQIYHNLNIFNIKEILSGTNINNKRSRATNSRPTYRHPPIEQQTKQIIAHIMSEFNSTQGGYDESAMGGYEDVAYGGEDYNGGLVEGKAMQLADRLVEHRKKITGAINEYIGMLTGDIDQVTKATEEMGTEMGTKIKANDDLLEFISTFDKFRGFFTRPDTKTKLYQHLLELNIDAVDSRQIKADFFDILKLISSKASGLGSSEGITKLTSALAKIKAHTDSATDRLKNFQENIKKSGGASELNAINELFSQSMSKVNISAVLNAVVKLETASKKLTFFKDIAVFRGNLKRTASELTSYSESYPDLVGKTIGEAVNRIKTEYDELFRQIDDNKSGLGLEINMHNDNANIKEKISKQDLKFIYQWQCDARIGLYKTIEAVDLLLYHFTDSVAKNPDAVADLHKMLTATKIIAKWYDIESGKNLIKVLESFKDQDGARVAALDADFDAAYTNDATIANYNALTAKIGPSRAKEVLQRCKAAVEGITVLKNIISYFVNIGEKYGDKNSEKHIYMSPNVIYKNLVNYVWASAFTLNVAGHQIMDNDNKIKRLLTVEDTKIGLAKASDAADPEEIGMHSNRLDILKVKILRAQNEVLNFKNQFTSFDTRGRKALYALIMSLFSKFKDNKEYFIAIARLGFQPPDAYIINDMIRGTDVSIPELQARALAVGSVQAVGPNRDDRGLVSIDTLIQNDDPIAQASVGLVDDNTNVAFGMDTDQPVQIMRRVHYLLDVIMNDMWNEYTKSNNDNPFILDDTYFVMVLKSMVGKIISVAGINRIFKSPKDASNSIINNRTRLIAGGVVDTEDVIPEAAELYVRIPLLIEFYYKIFDNGNKDTRTADDIRADTDNELVSFVPEVGSVWSKIIQIIFEKAKYIDSGIYTKDNISKIIAEINMIYKHYKNSAKTSDDLARHVLLELVSEINRRYGVVKKQELLNYYQVIQDTKRNAFGDDFNEIISTTNDYDILDESGDFEKDSPADKYLDLKKTLDSKSATPDEKITKLTEFRIVKDFRDKIEREFRKVSGRHAINTTPDSLRTSIRELKKDLAQTENKTSQYDLIINAIEQVQNVNQTKMEAYVMFHETVIAPLTLLQEVYFTVVKFLLKYFVVAHEWQEGIPDTIKNINIGATSIKNHLDAIIAHAAPPYDTYADLTDVYNGYRDKHHMFVESLLSLSNSFGMLVKLNITSTDRIVLDVSELQNKCELLLASIKSMVSRFTGVVDQKLIDSITGSTNTNAPRVGSIAWIDKNLMSVIFDKNVYRDRTQQSALTFDVALKLMPSLVNKFYTDEWNFQSLVNNVILPSHDVAAPLLYKDTNDKVDHIYKSVRVSAENYNKVFDKSQLLKDVFTIYNANAKSYMGISGKSDQDIKLYSYLFNIRGDRVGTNTYSTIVQEFNTLVYQYLVQMYDNGTKKFYSKLVDNFVSSGIPDAVNNGYTYPDIQHDKQVPAVFGNVCYGNSPVSSIVAYTIYTLINRIHPISNLPVFKLSELSEVSPSNFETIKVKLPIFSRMMKLFIEKCKVYRRLLIKVNSPSAVVNVSEDAGVTIKTSVFTNDSQAVGNRTIINSGLDYVVFGKVNAVAVAQGDAKTEAVLLIDNIINSMRTLVSDVDGVIAEIRSVDNSPPFMFDIRKDFAKNFLSDGDKELPFGPFSTMTASLNSANISKSLVPLKNNANVKYLYAMRAPVMSKSIELKDMPYMKQLVQKYNSFSQSANAIEEKKFNDMLASFMALYHTVSDEQYFFGAFDKFQVGKHQAMENIDTPRTPNNTQLNDAEKEIIKRTAISKYIQTIKFTDMDFERVVAENGTITYRQKSAPGNSYSTQASVDLIKTHIADALRAAFEVDNTVIPDNMITDAMLGGANNAERAASYVNYMANQSPTEALANAITDVAVIPEANLDQFSKNRTLFSDMGLDGFLIGTNTKNTMYLSLSEASSNKAAIVGQLRTYQALNTMEKSIMLLEGYNLLQNKKTLYDHINNLPAVNPAGQPENIRAKFDTIKEFVLEELAAYPINTVALNVLAAALRTALRLPSDTRIQRLTRYARIQTAIDALDDNAKQVIITAYENTNKEQNPRSAAVVANIIDMNVVPINVHALMREIPLVNLYNYSITFDESIRGIMGEAETGTQHAALVGLLKKPYSGNITDAIAVADDNKHLGVLSDVLNKYIINKGGLTDAQKKVRLDTKLVRNLIFFTLLQRAIRVKVRKELEFINTRVVSNTATVTTAIDKAMYDENMTPDANGINFDF